MKGSRIELLVTVKAYPQPDVRHGEAVCIAGVRTDLAQPQWARLYPILFRDLDRSRQFRKYQFISVDAQKPRDDARPESLLPNCDTLELGEVVDTRRNWSERRRFLDPLIADSMCALQRDQKTRGTSLGFFKPARVEGFDWEPVPSAWTGGKMALLGQQSLLARQKAQLEKIPYRFRYHYHCSDSGCSGHSQMIVDWEVGEGYRDWKRRYGDEQATLDKLRQKWLHEMCGPEKDTYFFAGNMAKHPESFLILGVFWPKV